jgi:hypothetical protein
MLVETKKSLLAFLLCLNIVKEVLNKGRSKGTHKKKPMRYFTKDDKYE